MSAPYATPANLQPLDDHNRSQSFPIELLDSSHVDAWLAPLVDPRGLRQSARICYFQAAISGLMRPWVCAIIKESLEGQ